MAAPSASAPSGSIGTGWSEPVSGGEVRYGTAGWSFPDWYGPFYPARHELPADGGPGPLFGGPLAPPPDPDVGLCRRDPLAFYARWFDAVEVNASFYRIPEPGTVERWVRTTARSEGPPFLFAFKLPSGFTHERAPLERQELRAFRTCLEPVQGAGVLGAVLAQFPHSFRWGEAAREHLGRVIAALSDLPLVVEVRHRSWEEEAALEHLRRSGAALCNVDQPPVDGSMLAPAARVTTPRLAYVRLHGRNVRSWFARDAGRDARYDYLYGPDELGEWAERIDHLSGLAERTLVIANNHYRGQAPANALELRRLREGPQVPVPAPLARTYPRLVASPGAGGRRA